MADIDFRGLADAALARANTLVPQWLPDGHKSGGEWKALNPVRGDKHEGSFSVNLTKGAWGDFATDDRGNDLVSLYAYLFCGDAQVVAARQLADELGLPELCPPARGPAKAPRSTAKKAEKPAAPPKEKPLGWVPVLPVPEDAPEAPAAHEFRGLPQARWAYRNTAGQLLGFIWRFPTSDGGKEVLPLTYCRHEVTGKGGWRGMAFPDPRPLYGLEKLAAMPTAPVLIVEGEKCVDAAQAELPMLAVLSWPGGGKAVSKADWSPLVGRKVMTWADCDGKLKKLSKADLEAGMDPLAQPLLPEAEQPGVKAMTQVRGLLHGLGCAVWNVTIPQPLERTDGWDVADAIAEGLKGEELADWIRQRAVLWLPEVPTEPISTASKAAAGERKKADSSEEPGWRDALLWKKGELDDCLANVFDILSHRHEWRGVVGFNELSLRVVKMRPPPFANGVEGDWEDVDDSRTAIWLTRQEEIAPSSARVMEAVGTLAKANCFHPVRDWLLGMPKHDGIFRLDHWLSDCLGVADTPYCRLVARWYLIGMVARVMEPGVKFDTCLVLEGTQGKGKSTALNILAGDYFDDTDLDLNNKDAMASLQGVWLHEFAEMGSLAKAEASKQKSFLSRRIDKYRPVYGRRDIKAPRQTVFAGSVNDWEWQKDPTGGRRFWPVMCSDAINLDLLRENREQLFAEALVAYLAKERFWPAPEQQKELFDPEQLEREQPESFIDALHDWVYAQVADFSVAMAVMEGLKLDASKLTRDLQTRVGIALRKLGCTRVEKRNGMVRYWYKPPVRNGVTSQSTGMASDQNGDFHAPF